MQAVLNFKDEEKKDVKDFLEKFPREKKGSKFEEVRCKINGCAVTLYSSGKLLIQGKNSEKVKEKILNGLQLKDELILGIDEVGRGEDFGPFVVAGVLGFTSRLREVRDSKKIKNIGEKTAIVMKNAVDSAVICFSASEIDSMRAKGKNMNEIEAKAINSIIGQIAGKWKEFEIIVDGGSLKGVNKKAKFLVKADDKIPQVSGASVLAKLVRENSADKEIRKSWKSGR